MPKNPFMGIVEKLVPHMHQEMPMEVKFIKSVDSGPLPEEADVATRETIQAERIRRQKYAHMNPNTY